MAREARVTLNYKGVDYPFYKTNRGNWDWENAGFTRNDLVSGKSSAALALAFFTLRACAQRAGKSFNDSLDEFIDNTDPDVVSVFERLEKEQKRINTEAKQTEFKQEKKPMPEMPANQ